MKRSLVAAFALLTIGAGFQSCKKSTSDNTKTINVTGLFSLTGTWNTLGIDSKAAIQFAADDINTYLKNKNANFRMSVSVYDTKLDPATATADFNTATAAGTRFIIGPQSSAELATIVPIAEAAQTIVVSQGSTAGSLALGGDPVFRFCPSDKVEGPAIANTIYNSGVKGLVTVARNDAGNLGLQSSTGEAFAGKGGTVSALPAYSTTDTDFTAEIADIKAQLTQLDNTYGAAQTAVYLASFDEGAQLFAQAVTDSQLSQVKWYGGDGVALSAAFIGNGPASQFAIRTSFFAPSFGLPASLQSKWQPLVARIQAATGITPDAFTLAAYDAMWVIAYTLEATNGGTASFADMKTVFAQQANSYTGVTGSTELDSYGDRDSGAFDYYGITKTDSTYTWTVVGKSE